MNIGIQVPEKLTFFFDPEWVRYRVAYGGRSSGKSWAAERGLLLRAMRSKIRILCCREYQNSIAESVKHTLEENIELLGLTQYFRSTKESIYCVYTGSQFIFRGLHNNVSEIKSLENISIAYVEEAENVSEESWQTLIPTIRAPLSEIWVVFNPKKVQAATYQRFVVNPPRNAIIRKINYDENPFCPDIMNEEAEEMRLRNPGLFRHVWLGECRTADERALWKHDMIDAARLNMCGAELERIVVGVDPAVTSKTGSDLTGIVAAGRARNRKTGEMEYYVLEDRSMRSSPTDWAKAVTDVYVDYDADRVIGEVNNGGDLIEELLRRYDATISYKAVRATRGKILRAEPIASLYERGLVHHVGTFPNLEEEMCSFVGAEGEKSPDRLDALVWALTELSSGENAEPEVGEIAISY